MDATVDKIRGMMLSGDLDMVKLGMILALRMGETWCRLNMPRNENSKNPIRHKIPAGQNQAIIGYSKGNVAIYLGWNFVHCRRIDSGDISKSILEKLIKVE